MRSQIPRPDEPIIDKKTGLVNRTWYRWFSLFASEAALTEVTADASQAMPPPNLSPIQNSIADLRKLDFIAQSQAHSGTVESLALRIKVLEALVLGQRQVSTAAAIGAVSTTLVSAHLFVGNASNVATDRAITGDVTISNTGVTTIGAATVTEAMQVLADNTTNDVSTTKHGYAPKGDGSTSKFLNANGAYSTPASSAGGAMSLIATSSPTGTGVVTFSSIPATFAHLLVMISGRSTAGVSPGVNVNITLNNDTGGNYDNHVIALQNATLGNGGSAAGATSIDSFLIPHSGATASNSGGGEVIVQNYADTNLFKHLMHRGNTIGATSLGTTWLTRYGAALWRSTTAVNRLDFTLSAGNWASGSRLDLYGLS